MDSDIEIESDRLGVGVVDGEPDRLGESSSVILGVMVHVMVVVCDPLVRLLETVTDSVHVVVPLSEFVNSFVIVSRVIDGLFDWDAESLMVWVGEGE
ncbi:unnamed protein product, partial [marine sediment metagenome]